MQRLLVNVLLSLPVEDIVSLCATDPDYVKFCNNEYLWKRLVRRDYPAAIKGPTSWKELYYHLHSFSISSYFVTLTNYSSSPDLEWELMSRDVKNIVDVLQTQFRFVTTQTPLFKTDGEEVKFYFKVAPISSGTVYDFMAFTSEWIEEINEINKRLDKYNSTIGEPGYYIEKANGDFYR